jgi:hypothetical protein
VNSEAPGVRGPDFSDEYRTRATQLARRFAVMEGVVGVALTGDLTLGEADRHSAVDLIVYLHERTLRTWHLGEAPLPEGESRYHGLRLDLAYRDYADELARQWSWAERWQARRAEILYDPEGRVRELFEAKAVFEASDIAGALLAEASHARHLLDRAVPAWLYRGDSLAAHDCLNRAVVATVRVVYLANEQPAPDDARLTAMTRELERLPARWSDRLAEVLTVSEPSAAEASRRRRLLSRLLRDCWALAFPGETLEARPSTIQQTRMLREMARRGILPLRVYRERFNLSLLIQSPAFDLLTVRRHDPEPYVHFDYDRLNLLLEDELGRFFDHQQRLLRELASIVNAPDE